VRVAKQRSVKELGALRRQCMKDGTKYKNIAVGPPKFLYWRFEHVKGVIRENWQFQYKHPIGGQSMKVGLGSCADVTLAEARERGSELLRIYNQELCPKTELARRAREKKAQAVKVVRFKDYYGSALENLTSDLEDKGRAQWRSTIEKYVLPYVGETFVGEIDVNDVYEILQQRTTNNVSGVSGPFWETTHETANRLRSRLERIFRHWANLPPQAKGYSNPADPKNGLEQMLPKHKKKKAPHPSMPWIDLPDWYKWLDHKQSVASANCLRFMTLIPSRSKEIRDMRWDELDLAKGRWYLEHDRMKTRKKFTQLLSRQAVRIIQQQPRIGDYVWKGTKISSNALDKIVKQYVEKTDIKFVQHGFRSSYLTWCAEQNENFTHSDMNLAHQQDKLTQIYQRSELLEQRQEVLQNFANYVTGELS